MRRHRPDAIRPKDVFVPRSVGPPGLSSAVIKQSTRRASTVGDPPAEHTGHSGRIQIRWVFEITVLMADVAPATVGSLGAHEGCLTDGYGGPTVRIDAWMGPFVCASPHPTIGEPEPQAFRPWVGAVMAAARGLDDGDPITRRSGVGAVKASPSENQRENRPTPGSPRCVDLGVEAEGRLRRSSYLALRDVSCHERAGVLQLRGRLNRHYLKQVAQEIVAEIEGVHRIDNLIEVRSASSASPRMADRTAKAGDTESNGRKPQSPEGPGSSTHLEGSRGPC